MEAILRLQPFDFCVAILWAAIFGWGFQSGAIRQVVLAVGAYVAAIAAANLYHPLGGFLASVFGREGIQSSEWAAYLLLYFAVLIGVGVLSYRVYPNTRLGVGNRFDRAIGALVAAIWALILAIVMATILRFYTEVFWPGQEAGQAAIREQLQQSISIDLLESTPLWDAVVPWFPSSLSPR